jgi:hypothetical protein
MQKFIVITGQGKVMVFNVRACAELYAFIENGKLIEDKELNEETMAFVF